MSAQHPNAPFFVEFTGGDFEAYNKAIRWLEERGFSYGSMQRDEPIGILHGDYAIAKWRNLNDQERLDLDGVIKGDKRNGPVSVTIYDAGKVTRQATEK